MLENIQPPIQWETVALSPEVKGTALEADHSPQSRADIKNDGAITASPYAFMTYY
jgi:hypothetical protein